MDKTILSMSVVYVYNTTHNKHFEITIFINIKIAFFSFPLQLSFLLDIFFIHSIDYWSPCLFRFEILNICRNVYLCIRYRSLVYCVYIFIHITQYFEINFTYETSYIITSSLLKITIHIWLYIQFHLCSSLYSNLFIIYKLRLVY